MDAVTRRRLIAQKSPIQRQTDPHHLCEDCGRELTMRDLEAYCVAVALFTAVPMLLGIRLERRRSR